ncbi:u9-ctenitoxin-Pr1a [Caerostris extrusa]|uniref:U9-ctenitoxin-Pr1a n=1 Tax=Caerostris extrusa TaxID=172846 RepID=A0AAV4VPQ4_CAEEX|nr:u9-ctenitoxin-Pr1a [Caerostris extrusa]
MLGLAYDNRTIHSKISDNRVKKRTSITNFLLLAFAVVSADYCGSLESCAEGQCCSGGFYHRYCRSYADEGMPCEMPNRSEHYTVACPCKEGLICMKPFFRCQKI